MYRHRFLDLRKINFPVTAIVSIIHRISGIMIFFMLPIGSIIFIMSLKSQDEFLQISHLFNLFFIKLILGVGLILFFYHCLAGIRHLLMDLGFFESFKNGKITAWVILFFTFIFIILGLRLWL